MDWLQPVALFTALLARPSTVDRLLELCEPVANRWECAARFGLREGEIATVARKVVDIGCAELTSADLPSIDLPQEMIAEITDAVQTRVRGSRSSR
jgi:glutamate--cysteine ligase